MASKRQPQQQQNKPAQIEQTELLQAVVILETYTNKFKPLNIDTAECLLPLLGKPLIDYTLEFLIEQQHVEELHLFCTNHYQKIKTYLQTSKWRAYDVSLHRNVGCSSFGETMREIDRLFTAKGLTRSNFILVTAPGIISFNINLEKQLESHKQRCKTDKNAIMTVICSNYKTNATNLNFNNHENKTYLIHDSENCLKHYDNSYDSKVKSKIPYKVMDYLRSIDTRTTNVPRSASKLKYRVDLSDTQIYFCNSYVLPIFTDNFDTQSMTDFMHAVLSDEISGYSIHCEILERVDRSYVSIINDLNSYYFQTMKLLQRSSAYNLKSNRNFNIKNLNDSLNVFFDKDRIQFGRNICFRRNVFIESNCEIGDDCVLINCYIGENCKLGSNVNISNAIILENTIIGDNNSLNACLIGTNVQIGNNCKFTENILFSNDCVINENTVFDSCGQYYVPNDSEGFSDDDDDEDEDKNEEENNSEDDSEFSKKVDKVTSDVDRLKVTVKKVNYEKYVNISSDDTNDDAISGADTDGETDTSERRFKSKAKNTIPNELYESLKQFYVWPIKKPKKIDLSRVKSDDNGSDNGAFNYTNDDEYEEEDEFIELDDSDDDSSSGDSYEDDESNFDDENSESEVDSDVENAGDNEKGKKSGTETNVSTNKKPQSDAARHDVDETFINELNNLLKRALREKTYKMKDLILEINGLKFAYYVEMEDICYYITKLLLEYPLKYKQLLINLNGDLNENSSYLDSILVVINLYKQLFLNYFCNESTARQTQFILLNSIIDFYISNEVDEASYMKLLLKLNQDFEILDDDFVVLWYNEKLAASEGKKKLLLNKLDGFINWLKQDDEEDDDEEDDDDDEDETDD